MPDQTIRFVTFLLLGFCPCVVNSFLTQKKYFSIINVLPSPIWPTCACLNAKALHHDASDGYVNLAALDRQAFLYRIQPIFYLSSCTLNYVNIKWRDLIHGKSSGLAVETRCHLKNIFYRSIKLKNVNGVHSIMLSLLTFSYFKIKMVMYIYIHYILVWQIWTHLLIQWTGSSV